MFLVWCLCLPCVLAVADRCHISHRSQPTVSPILESLQCWSDYKSFFQCKWKEEPSSKPNGKLKLWLKVKNGRSGLCEDYTSNEEGITQCRYETKTFSPGTTYTAFFEEMGGFCSSGQSKSLDLHSLLRPQAPVSLTTSRTDDGGRLLTWSSPYSQPSAFNDGIHFQLSYRPEGHGWTSEETFDNRKKLEKLSLIPGRRYEAQVRAQLMKGPWSHWSPTVSWYTPPDVDTEPPVDCVLLGEKDVLCRWEQSIETVHFISYQLVARHNDTALAEPCQEEEKAVVTDAAVGFSCVLSLTSHTSPLTSSLKVELVPKHSIKIFDSTKNVHPDPPSWVSVCEAVGQNWRLDWTPAKIRYSSLDHEVCYYSLEEEEEELEKYCNESSKYKRIWIPSGSSSVTILASSLRPSHKYAATIRSHVRPPLQGPPSTWSPPYRWKSHPAPGPASNQIYVSVAAVLMGVFIMLFIVPVCRRKALVWMESVPSPGKSRVILDFKSLNDNKVNGCKVLEVDSVLTCSTEIFSPGTFHFGEEEGEEKEKTVAEALWSCDRLHVPPLEKTSLSFSGPYILCQAVEHSPVEDSLEQTEVDVGRPASVRTLSEGSYVLLPGQERVYVDQASHSLDRADLCSTSTEHHEHSNSFQPPESAIQASGYCQLPVPDTSMEPSTVHTPTHSKGTQPDPLIW